MTILQGYSRSIAQKIGEICTGQADLQPISFKSDRLLGLCAGIRKRLMRPLHLSVQPRNVILDGLPDDFHVYLEIAVCYRVTHLIGESQGQIRVSRRVLGEVVFDVVAGLADDLEVTDHGILNHLILQELHFVHIFGVAIDALDGLKNMAQVIRQPLFVAAHMGSASASTVARNLSGSAFGVRTLKSLGGLVVIDLVGRGHDGAALLAAARTAFAPDNPGVAIGPVGRFGTMELSIPRRDQPLSEILCEPGGAASARTLALRFMRRLETEAMTQPGARLSASCAPEPAAAMQDLAPLLADRIGARFTISERPGWPRERLDVAAL